MGHPQTPAEDQSKLKPSAKEMESRPSDHFLALLRNLGEAPLLKIEETLKVRNFEVQRWNLPGGEQAIFGQTSPEPNASTLLLYHHFPDSKRKSIFFELTNDSLSEKFNSSLVNLAAFLTAFDLFLEKAGNIPLNIKVLVEGTSGKVNPSLGIFLKKQAEVLGAAAMLWPMGGFSPEGRPFVLLGSKGSLSIELASRPLSKDGDGSLSGIIPSAAWRLTWALNSIKGETEEIGIRGFGDERDDDISVPAEELSLLVASAGEHKTRLANRLKEFGLEKYLMELRDPQVLLTEYFTPSANISSFQTGTRISGQDNFLPAKARARLDFSLVPNQQPETVFRLLNEHLREKGFEDIKVKEVGVSLKPAFTPRDNFFAELVINSLKEDYQFAPLIIPFTSRAEPMALFKAALNDIPVVGLGLVSSFGQSGDSQEVISPASFEDHARNLFGVFEKMAREPFPEPFQK